MGNNPIVDWALIDWRKAEQTVYRLPKCICKASRRGETQVVHTKKGDARPVDCI